MSTREAHGGTGTSTPWPAAARGGAAWGESRRQGSKGRKQRPVAEEWILDPKFGPCGSLGYGLWWGCRPELPIDGIERGGRGGSAEVVARCRERLDRPATRKEATSRTEIGGRTMSRRKTSGEKVQGGFRKIASANSFSGRREYLFLCFVYPSK